MRRSAPGAAGWDRRKPAPTVWPHWFRWWPGEKRLAFWQHVGRLVKEKGVRKDDRDGVVDACREVSAWWYD